MLLAIESSCDETAAAVIDRQRQVRSTVVASQFELHRQFGGVVPEIASRAHVRHLLPVIAAALKQANVSLSDLTAIAVATEPGLVGSLLVGLTAAKALALALDLPLVTVNHLQAHLYACQMATGRDLFPAVGFVVSGGHTNLYDCRSSIDQTLIGATLDDAAGEAFDKTAAILGLGFPGGPAIEKAAVQGNRTAYSFPRTFLHDERLDFSFSGLKTAVLYAAKGQPGKHAPPPPELTANRIADLCASFQEAVFDVLIGKCEQALRRLGAERLLIGGGVAANGRFRERLQELTARGIEVHVAPREYCTDNAAMGAVAWDLLEAGRTADLDVDVHPGLLRASRKVVPSG